MIAGSGTHDILFACKPSTKVHSAPIGQKWGDMLHVDDDVASEAYALKVESQQAARHLRQGTQPRGPSVTERLMGALEGSGPDSVERKPATVKWTVHEGQGEERRDLAHIEVTLAANISSAALPSRGSPLDTPQHVIPQVWIALPCCWMLLR